jgi:hypothetical protein
LLLIEYYSVGRRKRFLYASVAPGQRSEVAVPEIPQNDYTIFSILAFNRDANVSIEPGSLNPVRITFP